MKTGFLTYIAACWERASKGSVLLTDKMSIILVPIGSVTFWGLQRASIISSDLDIDVGELVSFVVVFTVVGGILLRLLMSPYLVWKDQNQTILDLDSQLALPEQIERKWMADYLAEARAELSKSISIISVNSSNSYIWSPQNPRTENAKSFIEGRTSEMWDAMHTAALRAEELGYISGLRGKVLDIINACQRLITAASEGEKTDTIRIEITVLRNELLRILHHR